MTKFLIAFASAICLVACQETDKNGGKTLTPEEKANALTDSSKFTTIEWLDSTTRSLGTIKEGKKVEVLYHFRNSGNNNLIFTNVQASCGCTAPDWPQEPILPGGEGVIKAVFDSKGTPGTRHNQVYVMANTRPENQTTLSFNVEVAN
jgi:hypothetical protein